MLELEVQDGSKTVVLQFEHSLLSLSKWESRTKKAFLSKQNKLPTEMIDYFQDMIITPEVDKNLVYALEPKQLDQLAEYINDKMTASSVPAIDEKPSREIITSELIYYWMVALQIPFEAEKWHLNRLMMLIQITNFKSQPEKKQNKAKMMEKWRQINEQRKKQFNTTG